MAIDLNQPEVIDATTLKLVQFWQRGVNAMRANMTYAVHSVEAEQMTLDDFLAITEAQDPLLSHIDAEYMTFKKNEREIAPSPEDKFIASTFGHDTLKRLHGRVIQWTAIAKKNQQNLEEWLIHARGIFNVNPTPYEYIRALAESYLNRISDKRIKILYSGLSVTWTFRTAEIFDLAKVIFENLLDNAIKYGKEDGELHMIRDGNDIIFKDDGIGMDPKFAARLGKGTQIREERAEGVEGSGIGWASMANDLRALKWSWDIETQVDQGTKVTIHVKEGDIIPTEEEKITVINELIKTDPIPAEQIVRGMEVFNGAKPYVGYNLINGPHGKYLACLNVSASPIFIAIRNAQPLMRPLNSAFIRPPTPVIMP